MSVTKKKDLSHLTEEELSPYEVQGITVLYDFGASNIKRYPDNTVIKTGGKIRRQSEAAALRFTAQLGIPTPRLFEVIEDKTDKNDEIQIRMGFIEGQTLGSVWPSLSPQQKRDICHQVRRILDKMREAEWPGKTIGSCEGGPVLDTRIYGIKFGGPFATEEDLIKFILDIYDLTPQPMKDTLSKHQRANHRIVFSHGDLHQDNILVKNGKVTGLIDWEQAGWYPEYWDYIKFCFLSPEHRDWMDYANDIFSQTYDDELLFYLALSRFWRG